MNEQVFREKNSCLGKWAILVPEMAEPRNSGSAVRFFFLILHNERAHQVDENSIKGFVCYIFACLFFKSKREHLSN